jgi:ribosomal protein S14
MMVSQPSNTMSIPQRSPSQSQFGNYPGISTSPLSKSHSSASSSFGSKPIVSSYGSPPINPNYSKPSSSSELRSDSLIVASPANLSTMKPTWDTTKENVNCQNCNTEFSFFKRRHHCRCCFRELCDTCTVKRSPVPSFGHKDAQRWGSGNNRLLIKKGSVILVFRILQKEILSVVGNLFPIFSHSVGILIKR